MKQPSYFVRSPDGYRDDGSQRSMRKWQEVTSLFYEERICELKLICRHGGRGRIFSALVMDLLKLRGISYKQEPIFKEVEYDSGQYKEICSSVRFPNAEVRCVESMLPQEVSPASEKLKSRLRLLKEMKGILR